MGIILLRKNSWLVSLMRNVNPQGRSFHYCKKSFESRRAQVSNRIKHYAGILNYKEGHIYEESIHEK